MQVPLTELGRLHWFLPRLEPVVNGGLEQSEIVLCGGGAGPEDTHLAVAIHCVDDEIIKWLERRERRRRKRDSPFGPPPASRA
jgi:hypothetical protein